MDSIQSGLCVLGAVVMAISAIDAVRHVLHFRRIARAQRDGVRRFSRGRV